MPTFPPGNATAAVDALMGSAADRDAHVQANTSVQNATTLEHTEGWADTGGPFPCFVVPLGGDEVERAAQLDPRARVEVRFPDRPATAITAESRIRVVATATAPARLLPVVYTRDPQGDGRSLYAVCRED
jgi:head-tail adaptor